MILVQPSLISLIDRFAAESLGVPMRTLMLRAGQAVADAVRSVSTAGSRVVVFAGKGNNGGDGYAAALLLMTDYKVLVYDVFSAGQRTDEGKYFLEEYVDAGGAVENLVWNAKNTALIQDADCYVDAIFGTGFSGEFPSEVVAVADLFRSQSNKKTVAIDVPLGVDASLGSVDTRVAYTATVTVSLGFVKTGLVSYPARDYVGKMIYDNIGLQNMDVLSEFEFSEHYIDRDFARAIFPKRKENSNKGSFGKLLAIVGSDRFPGAAHLTLEAALRSGVGLVTHLGDGKLCDRLLLTFPEIIYKPLAVENIDESGLDKVSDVAVSHSAVLVGSGSSRSAGLYRIIERLLSTEGAPLILDADAINVLAEKPEVGRKLLSGARRRVILTPHPLEFARISELTVDFVQSHRIEVARRFAMETGTVLVLKGAATVVTDGRSTYVNSSGSSALAKAGSGDVLAGVLSSLVASGMDPLSACALSVYLHGVAADVLSEEFSRFGVTPSDLPREVARQIAKLEKNN